jgi:hypothetical protein
MFVFTSVIGLPVVVFITYRLMVACLKVGSCASFLNAELKALSVCWAKVRAEEITRKKRNNFFNEFSLKMGKIRNRSKIIFYADKSRFGVLHSFKFAG